jgi:hypothetical protein
MIDTLTSYNRDDFSRRYSGTYGWLLQGNTEIFVLLNRVDSEKVSFSTGNNLPYYANVDSGTRFKFIPVKNGWFNANDGNTYLLSRQPARQWKRGIADSNTTITSIAHMSDVPLTYKVLSTIFNDNYSKLNPIKTWEGRSCALSQHFAVSPNNRLYFYRQIIGEYDPLNKAFILEMPIVKQELEDLINRNNWFLKVIDANNQ